jgi:F-type H+-transporting ATPase subunit b
VNLDLSVLWIILFVLALTAIVNRLLFRPVLTVMAERERAITSARALADDTARRAKAAADEFESQTTAARAEIYKAMDERRREALDYRATLLTAAREDVEARLRRATADVDAARATARATLEREARTLGSAIAARVLERSTS